MREKRYKDYSDKKVFGLLSGNNIRNVQSEGVENLFLPSLDLPVCLLYAVLIDKKFLIII